MPLEQPCPSPALVQTIAPATVLLLYDFKQLLKRVYMYIYICICTCIYQTPPYAHQDTAHQLPRKQRAVLPVCLTEDPLILQRHLKEICTLHAETGDSRGAHHQAMLALPLV